MSNRLDVSEIRDFFLAIRQNDEENITMYYEKYKKLIGHSAYRVWRAWGCPRRIDLADVQQHVSLQILRAAARVDLGSHSDLRKYFIATIYGAARDYVGREMRRSGQDYVDFDVFAAMFPDEKALAQVRDALRDDDQKRIVCKIAARVRNGNGDKILQHYNVVNGDGRLSENRVSAVLYEMRKIAKELTITYGDL